MALAGLWKIKLKSAPPVGEFVYYSKLLFLFHIVSETGALKRQQSTPEEDLKNIATNVLINELVHKYWIDDLKVIEMRNKANQKFTGKSYAEAMDLYNRAFNMTPYDHLVLGNR